MHIRVEKKVILTKIASLSFLWIPCESYFSFQTYLQHQPFSDCTKSYWLYSFQLIIEIMTRSYWCSIWIYDLFLFFYVLRWKDIKETICIKTWKMCLYLLSELKPCPGKHQFVAGCVGWYICDSMKLSVLEEVVVLVLVGLVIVLLDVIYIFIKKLWSVNIVIKLAYEL